MFTRKILNFILYCLVVLSILCYPMIYCIPTIFYNRIYDLKSIYFECIYQYWMLVDYIIESERTIYGF
jgi:hypothetical protein